MNINRHNYEEYFLLYIDNELTIEQKKQVELFVKENPDLEEEMVMLQQSKLIPDNITVFQEKHLLMKEENNSIINLNNYEEWLVLYVDNELNAGEKKMIEEFAAAHPHVQTELSLFQQTKLGMEEEFSFPNRELLYRKEEKVKVISISWWRMAAAAVLIIGTGITMYSVFSKGNNAGSAIGKGKLPVTKNEQAPNSIKSSPTAQQPQEQKNPEVKKEDKERLAVNSTPTPIYKPKQKENKKHHVDNLPAPDNEQAMVEPYIPRERPILVNEINTAKPKDPKMSNALVPGNKMYKRIINDSVVTKQLPQTPDEYASNTENKRLRGFFRKATRLIERTTNINPANDDDRVLIGGMAINLK